MNANRLRAAAWAVLAGALVLYVSVVAMVVTTLHHERSTPPSIILESVVIFAGYSILGGVIASRRPRNMVGWSLLAGGALGAVHMAADEYAARVFVTGLAPLPGATLLAWLSEWTFYPHVIFSVLLPFFLFPDGRPHRRVWRIALAAPLTACALLLSSRALAPSFGDFSGIPNPFAVPALQPLGEAARAVGLPLMLVSMVLAIPALISRFRASRGAERQQMKWFAYGVSLMGLSVLVMFAVPAVGGAPLPVPVQRILLLSLLAIPVTAAIGILRHRLYDIDVVVSRTVTYGALAVVVTAMYVTMVAVLGAVLGGGEDPSLPRSIVATVLIAIAFHPVRERLQRVANRLVYGPRATPYETLASFASRVSTALSLDEALPRIAEAAAKGVGAERAQVTLRLGQTQRVTTWPEGAVGDTDYRVPVAYRGETIGEIAVAKARGDEVRPAEAALLRDLASQAALVMHNVRLTLELQDRLDEILRQAQQLQESRRRLVAAHEIERRRLERNLHDGAQQNLVSLSGQLRLLGGLLGTEPARARALVESLVAEADQALEDIRSLARGIFPKILSDKGLFSALRAHMAKHVPNGELLFDAAHEHRRFDLDTESAVYFCCVEALQNAAKHAGTARVVVSVQLSEDVVRFSVADDGPGFDPSAATDGTGLVGITDRVAARGGTVSVESAPGRGTVVSGVVPLVEAWSSSRRIHEGAAAGT